MADYPGSIPAFVTPGATLSSPAHSTQHTAVNGEVVAICATLGTNPQGIESTVKDRLDAIEASIGTTNHNQNTDLGTTSTTFYIGGIAGPYLKNVAGNLQLRNSADVAYVNVTVLDINVQGSITDGVNSVTVAELDTAVLDDHTHANKATLDTYTQTEVNLASAVSLKHIQNTDTGTNVETFQLNNVNPNSARIKVDDLTPTIVEIVNAADTVNAPIIASEFRGYLQADNADVSRPTIRYNEPTNTWQLANDGVTFSDITVGTPTIAMAGTVGQVQYNNTANLGAIPEGNAGQVLTSNGVGAAPSFQVNPAGFADPMTTRGDIIYRNAANTTTRLAAGATAGDVLTSDGTDIAWAAPSGGGGQQFSMLLMGG